MKKRQGASNGKVVTKIKGKATLRVDVKKLLHSLKHSAEESYPSLGQKKQKGRTERWQ